MIQEILTYSIITLTSIYVIFSFFRFLKPKKSSSKNMSGSGCANCPVANKCLH